MRHVSERQTVLRKPRFERRTHPFPDDARDVPGEHDVQPARAHGPAHDPERVGPQRAVGAEQLDGIGCATGRRGCGCALHDHGCRAIREQRGRDQVALVAVLGPEREAAELDRHEQHPGRGIGECEVPGPRQTRRSARTTQSPYRGAAHILAAAERECDARIETGRRDAGRADDHDVVDVGREESAAFQCLRRGRDGESQGVHHVERVLFCERTRGLIPRDGHAQMTGRDPAVVEHPHQPGAAGIRPREQPLHEPSHLGLSHRVIGHGRAHGDQAGRRPPGHDTGHRFANGGLSRSRATSSHDAGSSSDSRWVSTMALGTTARMSASIVSSSWWPRCTVH